MTAIGASLQLLPVATRRSVGSERWPAVIWWLYTPGVAMTALGMGTGATTAARRGCRRGRRGARHVRGAARPQSGRSQGDARRRRARLGRARVAGRRPRDRRCARRRVCRRADDRRARRPSRSTSPSPPTASWACSRSGSPTSSCRCSRSSAAPDERPALGIVRARRARRSLLAGIAAFDIASTALRPAAIVAAGSARWSLHLRLMRSALASRLASPARPLVPLVRVSVGDCSVASLALALGARARCAFRRHPHAVRACCSIAGWLLTFLLGLLQRIVPFLASMHAGQARHAQHGRAADAVVADRRAPARDPLRLPPRRAWRCSRWPFVADSPWRSAPGRWSAPPARSAYRRLLRRPPCGGCGRARPAGPGPMPPLDAHQWSGPPHRVILVP